MVSILEINMDDYVKINDMKIFNLIHIEILAFCALQSLVSSVSCENAKLIAALRTSALFFKV